jgi:hypothetical protein
MSFFHIIWVLVLFLIKMMSLFVAAIFLFIVGQLFHASFKRWWDVKTPFEVLSTHVEGVMRPMAWTIWHDKKRNTLIEANRAMFTELAKQRPYLEFLHTMAEDSFRAWSVPLFLNTPANFYQWRLIQLFKEDITSQTLWSEFPLEDLYVELQLVYHQYCFLYDQWANNLTQIPEKYQRQLYKEYRELCPEFDAGNIWEPRHNYWGPFIPPYVNMFGIKSCKRGGLGTIPNEFVHPPITSPSTRRAVHLKHGTHPNRWIHWYKTWHLDVDSDPNSTLVHQYDKYVEAFNYQAKKKQRCQVVRRRRQLFNLQRRSVLCEHARLRYTKHVHWYDGK